MNAAAQALAIVAAIVVGTVVFALWSVRRIPKDPQQFIVGGRSFGSLLLWMLFAGEIYSSFTFLGAAGWAYGKGAPAFYILAYGTVAYVIGYFLLPPIWRVAKERSLLTGPDFFMDRYGSKTLMVSVALLQFVLVIPYVTLQLSGLQILLSIAGYGRYDATIAVTAAFLLIALFVFTVGLRGTAWASVVKDVLVLGAVLFAGIALPARFFSSPGALVDRVLAIHPHWFTLAPGTANQGEVWYITTVLLTGIGFFMGPANAPSIYAARDEGAIRRNMMLMPLYQLVLLFVFFAGFAALGVHPGLRGPAVDQSFMLLLQRTYPAWLLGIVAGAGCLAALLPACVLVLGAASVLSKNVLGDALGLATADRSRTLATRLSVLVVAALALLLWLFDRTTLVELLLLYYNGVTQFFPGFVFALVWKRVSAWAVGAGIAAGEVVAFYLAYHQIELAGINPGFIALIVNVVLCCAVACAFPREKQKPAVGTAGF